MFAGDIGIAEDPATGSAALALGVWLAASGLVPAEGDHGLTVEQGVEMGRPSAATAAGRHRGRRAPSAAWSRARPSHVASGTIRVPD